MDLQIFDSIFIIHVAVVSVAADSFSAGLPAKRILGLGAGLFAMIVVGLVGLLGSAIIWARAPKFAGGACAATVAVVLAMLVFFVAAPHAPPGIPDNLEGTVYDYTAVPRIIVGVLALCLLIAACFCSLAGVATPVHVIEE